MTACDSEKKLFTRYVHSVLILVLIAGLDTATAQVADTSDPNDWIFVVSDQADHYTPGCDAISVFDTVGNVVYRGEQLVSPGRISVRHSGSSAFAISTNSGPFLYGLHLIEGEWKTTRYPRSWSQYDRRLEQGAPSYVSRDGWLYLSLRRSLGRFTAPGPRDAILHQPAAMSSPLVPGVIAESPTRSEIVVADVDSSTVRQLDSTTLADVRPKIPFTTSLGGSSRDELVRRLSGSVHPSGQWLVLSGGRQGAVVIVDLISHVSQNVPLTGLTETWGVAFDYASNGRLLAVHGREAVAVYEFHPRKPVLIEHIPVPPPRPGDWPDSTESRFGTLAWFVDGDGLVVNVGTLEEFRLLKFDEASHPALSTIRDINPCLPWRPSREVSAGFDVQTLNHARPSSTPSVTPSMTVTAAPSATPTTSATPSPASTTTHTATPAATHSHVPAFLPIVLNEIPCWKILPMDIAIVLDTSSSMLEENPSKLQRASAAIGQFATSLRLEDHVALVTFNSIAHLDLPLSSDRDLLQTALEAVEVGQMTRLDLGIRLARNVLGAGQRNSARKVIIILTDGRPNPVGGAEVRVEADKAKLVGVTIFTIGLGIDLDRDLLRAVASRPDLYFETPNADQLESIYSGLLQRIPCDPTKYWGAR